MPNNYKTIINFRDGIQVDANDLISQNGLVGIGTTIPREELDIRGNLIVENETNLRHVNVIGHSTHYGLVNVAVGYSVGIGTTVPEATFQVGVGTTGATITAEGTVTAQAFVGDGAGLTNLPTSVWNNDNPGAGTTIYAFRPVGVAKTFPQADFAVGDLIEVDAISGVGTFEGLEAKNLTLSGNAQQGNITMVGDIIGVQTVTGSGNIELTGIGSFGGLNMASGVMIGTARGVKFTGAETTVDFEGTSSNADSRQGIRFIETSGSTAAQAILYNGSVTGVGGTQSGQVEFWGFDNLDPTTIKYKPRTVITREGRVGIGTSRVDTDFNLDVVGTGTFTGSIGAAGGFIGDVVGDISGVAGLAEGLTGVPDIIVDEITSLGINSIYIRNTGISTFGGEVIVSNFVGVGSTSSALGKGLGVIGDADVNGDGTFSGNLTVGGDLSIGGTFGGSVNINDVTANELVVTGIMSGTTSSSAVLHDTTITGNVTQDTTKQSTFGAVTVGGTCRINAEDLFFGDASTQVSASGTVFANLSGIITTGRVACDVLDITTTFNYTGGGIGTFGSIELRGNTGVISCTDVVASGFISCFNMNATAGVTTVFDLDISDGNNTNLLIKKVGFNTTLNGIGIAEGIEMYDNAEISIQGPGGIGIGTTSGKRSENVDLYVGYRRDDVGSFIGGDVLFEGAVGIGTKVELNQGNSVEVYKNVKLFSNHTGVGGTEGGGLIRVGFDTANPQSAIDLGECDGSIILSRNSGSNPQFGRPGLFWYDMVEDRPAVYSSNEDKVGVLTAIAPTHDPIQYLEEIGFIGGIVDSDLQRRQRLQANSIDNVIQPGPEFGLANSVGFGTAHMLYNKAYDKHQYATTQGTDKLDASIFRSYVSSATSALNIELDSTGTKVIIEVAGVGTATLNLI
jgi:hypothetical protein